MAPLVDRLRRLSLQEHQRWVSSLDIADVEETSRQSAFCRFDESRNVSICFPPGLIGGVVLARSQRMTMIMLSELS